VISNDSFRRTWFVLCICAFTAERSFVMFATVRAAGRTLALAMVLLGVTTQAFAGPPPQGPLNPLPKALRQTSPIAAVEPVNFSAGAVRVGRLLLPSAAPGTAPVVTTAAYAQVASARN
jgi:hypothetical protein